MLWDVSALHFVVSSGTNELPNHCAGTGSRHYLCAIDACGRSSSAALRPYKVSGFPPARYAVRESGPLIKADSTRTLLGISQKLF